MLMVIAKYSSFSFSFKVMSCFFFQDLHGLFKMHHPTYQHFDCVKNITINIGHLNILKMLNISY